MSSMLGTGLFLSKVYMLITAKRQYGIKCYICALDENVVDVRYCLFTYSRGAKSTLTAVTLCEPLLDSMEASACSSYALVIHGNALILMEE